MTIFILSFIFCSSCKTTLINLIQCFFLPQVGLLLASLFKLPYDIFSPAFFSSLYLWVTHISFFKSSSSTKLNTNSLLFHSIVPLISASKSHMSFYAMFWYQKNPPHSSHVLAMLIILSNYDWQLLSWGFYYMAEHSRKDPK